MTPRLTSLLLSSLPVAVLISGCSSADTTAGPTTGATAPFASTPAAAGLEQIVVGAATDTFEWPVSAVPRPGHDELFVVERNGRITTVVEGRADRVVLDLGYDLSDYTEDGLLGLAFSPDGSFAYVQRTITDIDSGTGVSDILEYAVADDGEFDPVSERLVYSFDQPFPVHNGGEVLTGPDGMLWIPTGDGGKSDTDEDPDRRALDPTTPLGKLLRIDPRPTDDDLAVGRTWSVPPDNPFVGVEGVLPEIWANGLRSPWRASFDPETGDLWLGDVGANVMEEVDVVWADEGLGRGASFGWSAFEGSTPFHEDQDVGSAPLVQPFYEYRHEDGRCSVSVGERYRGSALPELVGWFVFADLCTGSVWALEVTDERTPGALVQLGVVEYPVAVKADAAGELWVLSYSGGLHPVVRR